MSKEMTILNSAAEIKAAMEAEQAERNSEASIASAVREFSERTGYQDNAYTASEIARFQRGDISAESLERAAEERMAWDPNVPLWKLKRFINGE